MAVEVRGKSSPVLHAHLLQNLVHVGFYGAFGEM
jgi:hypothetical protein